MKGGPAFTHISYNDYQIAYANIVEGKNLTIENRYLPYALFTDPQLGRVGITETEARESGRKFKLGTFPMSSVSQRKSPACSPAAVGSRVSKSPGGGSADGG